jgi:hypothetical protein
VHSGQFDAAAFQGFGEFRLFSHAEEARTDFGAVITRLREP